MTTDEIIKLAHEADPFGEHGRLYQVAELTPETLIRFAEAIIEYARANVARNTAMLRAEIEALRAEVDALRLNAASVQPELVAVALAACDAVDDLIEKWYATRESGCLPNQVVRARGASKLLRAIALEGTKNDRRHQISSRATRPEVGEQQ